MVGAILNAIAVTTNGGYMPINPNSVKYLGYIVPDNIPLFRSILLENPAFPLLGDWPIFILPPYYILAFSIGDFFILLGTLLFFLEGTVSHDK